MSRMDPCAKSPPNRPIYYPSIGYKDNKSALADPWQAYPNSAQGSRLANHNNSDDRNCKVRFHDQMELLEPDCDMYMKRHPEPEKEHRQQLDETYFTLAAIVTACFNCPIGIVAILCSMSSSHAYSAGDVKTGRFRAKMTLVLSMFGIVSTGIIVMIVVYFYAFRPQ